VFRIVKIFKNIFHLWVMESEDVGSVGRKERLFLSDWSQFTRQPWTSFSMVTVLNFLRAQQVLHSWFAELFQNWFLSASLL
jgi:hypothetical protein